MARPKKLTKADIQAAALDLVDAHGPEGLTMRALARELGTGTMTLYNYVADRDELELLVVEAVIAEAHWPTGTQADWRDDVRAVATALWRAARAHPRAIPLMLTRRARSPAVFDAAEALLAGLARGGRSGEALLVGFRAVTALVTGFAQAELAGPLTRQAGESASAIIERFRALPVESYPHLVEAAGAAAESEPADEFAAALDLLLDGLASERAT